MYNWTTQVICCLNGYLNFFGNVHFFFFLKVFSNRHLSKKGGNAQILYHIMSLHYYTSQVSNYLGFQNYIFVL